MVLGKDYFFHRSEQKIEFKNGSVVLFRHFDEPNKLKSLNLGFVEVEEMSDIPYDTFKMILGACANKSSQAGKPLNTGFSGIRIRKTTEDGYIRLL